MAADKQTEYIKKWFTKAGREPDVFDRFMSGWLALAIAAQRHRTRSGVSLTDDTDRERVIDYFSAHAAEVLAAIHAHKREMETLARRRGTRGGTVLDGARIQKHCRIFGDAVLGNAQCSRDDLSEAAAEILNKVRNNLFHGSKVYDDANDRALLELVTPLMLTIVQTCERLA